MQVILIGYRCTGKTSVGKILAGWLGMPFFDTDELIEARAGKTIPVIVADGGWETFRALERQAIEEICAYADCVIAPGGGAVMDRVNGEIMKRRGFLVWLRADEKTIMRRMEADGAGGKERPALLGNDPCEEVARVLREREPAYRAAADWSIETTGKEPESIAAEIHAYLLARRGLDIQR
jgi:shikimate kinase